ISNDHSRATGLVENLLESLTKCLPRFELYEKLQSDGLLQSALLNVFTDIVEFSVQASRFFRRGALRRLTHTVLHSFDRDIGAVIARLQRHARAADQAAVASQLLEASEFRKEMKLKKYEELKVECRKWLKPSDMNEVHLHQVQARLTGTCEWITSINEFKRWLETNSSTYRNRLLVVSGIHGSGKSVLASSIVTKLEASDQYTLFFAFSTLNRGRETPESLIRTILWQLLYKTADKGASGVLNKLRMDCQSTTSGLWESFATVALSLTKPVYCIIDGLDECSDFNHTLPTEIMHILGICPNLRIVLLGRPHALQTYLDNSCIASINITSTVLKQDIEAFIQKELAPSHILSIPEIYDKVRTTLNHNSDGMFLWVKLMVDDLKKSTSKFELSERLQQLPHGLEKAYRLIFSRLSHKLDYTELRLARDTLAFISMSCRPLHLDEFRYAHAVHCSSLQKGAQSLDEYLFLQPPQRLIDVCGGLILLKDGFLPTILIDVKEFHRSFAWVCIDYMMLAPKQAEDVSFDIADSAKTPRTKYPLLDYASVYTSYHLNRSMPLDDTTLNKIQLFLGSKQSILCAEYFAHLLFEDLTLDSQLSEFTDVLHWMADEGLEAKFSTIFANTLEDLTKQPKDSRFGNYPPAKWWDTILDLTRGTNPNTLNQKYGDGAPAGLIGRMSQENRREPSDSAAEDGLVSPNLHHQSHAIMSKSKDLPVNVSRISDLLKDGTPLSVARQIEIVLRLQFALNTTRSLIDPLKLLFQLIMKKASSIPVYALMVIGNFYAKLEKFHEALDVYITASEKVDHLEIPLKYQIYDFTGFCYQDLYRNEEALPFYKKAFIGREQLLGKRNCWTLDSLVSLIKSYSSSSSSSSCSDLEVLRLCDRLFEGQNLVSELDLATNIDILTLKARASHRAGSLDDTSNTCSVLRATLKQYCDSLSDVEKGKNKVLYRIGFSYYELDLFDLSLRNFQLLVEESQTTKGPNHRKTLYYQYCVAALYQHLHRHKEAKTLRKMIFAKQRDLLDPNDRHTLWTKAGLLENEEEEDICSACCSATDWESSFTDRSSSIDSRRSAFEEFDDHHSLQHQQLTES
ncbi:MAG: hypothetical protein Q9167_007516, partial [Letrouitia subvulpina]